MEIESFLEVVIVVIVIIGSALSTASKARRQRVAQAARQSSSPVRAKPAAPKPPHPYTPVQPSAMPPMSFGDIPGQVIAPTIHPHIQPDCRTHDAPGSLGVGSTEGKDPCHAAQLNHTRSFDVPVQTEPGLTLDWSGENMVKAFVMQEVLTRPAHRAR